MTQISNIWNVAFCRYTKDPQLIFKLVEYVKSVSLENALREAAEHIVVRGSVPDGLTLGFSPQIMIAIASARLSKGLDPSLHVITSPEVIEGKIDAAKYSHEILMLFKEQGLIKSLHVVRMSPSTKLSVEEILVEMVKVFKEVLNKGLEVLDISGGTQLVPIAAVRAGIRKMSYTYPEGSRVVIYSFEL